MLALPGCTHLSTGPTALVSGPTTATPPLADSTLVKQGPIGHPRIGHLGLPKVLPLGPYPLVFRSALESPSAYEPKTAAVNVSKYDDAEPAPMGVVDYGLSDGVADTYYSSQFMGQAEITAVSANANGGLKGDYVSFELDVVLVLTHDSSATAYWIQNVLTLNTSSRYIFAGDDIGNVSSLSSGVQSTTLTGNGSIYGNEYYADTPSATYAGNDVTLSYPTNISAKLVSSVGAGIAHVGFEYNDGFGWVTYDNVSFPWTRGWTDRGFEVNGSSYTPYGIFYDAEWVVGGPNAGANAAWAASNQSLSLDFFNGHNFEAVLNAYNFGSDTTETSSNVTESLLSGGAPRSHLGTGSGSLGVLYGRSDLGVVNVSTALRSGTLLVNGTATTYVGNDGNMTLVPASDVTRD